MPNTSATSASAIRFVSNARVSRAWRRARRRLRPAACAGRQQRADGVECCGAGVGQAQLDAVQHADRAGQLLRRRDVGECHVRERARRQPSAGSSTPAITALPAACRRGRSRVTGSRARVRAAVAAVSSSAPVVSRACDEVRGSRRPAGATYERNGASANGSTPSSRMVGVAASGRRIRSGPRRAPRCRARPCPQRGVDGVGRPAGPPRSRAWRGRSRPPSRC
jgi:hypothetical protein